MTGSSRLFDGGGVGYTRCSCPSSSVYSICLGLVMFAPHIGKLCDAAEMGFDLWGALYTPLHILVESTRNPELLNAITSLIQLNPTNPN
jgi:hypothetical protein